jgi:hypothetical protein
VASKGTSQPANYNVTSAILQQQTGRALAPEQAFQPVNLLLPGHLYGDRINAVDLREGKILRFGRTGLRYVSVLRQAKILTPYFRAFSRFVAGIDFAK